jgi:RimJ/RimL family protein N-acetyltransferase
MDDPEFITKWAEWMNDKTVAANYGGTPNLLVTMTSAKKTLESLTGYRFAILLPENDELIGHVSIHNVDNINRNAFIGIVIGNEADRGRGYGTEVLRLVLAYGFKTLNLHNIALTVHSDMQMAIACYKKIGFKEIGRMRDWVFKDGRYVDKIYMDILDREFALLE